MIYSDGYRKQPARHPLPTSERFRDWRQVPMPVGMPETGLFENIALWVQKRGRL